MKAILLNKHGGVEEMYIGEIPTPTISSDEVLVKVHATALNRADLLQRRGLYPPPPGENEVIGLEMAGEVVKVGDGVVEWRPSDRVFALLAGGGYAEYVKVHKDMLMPIPGNLGFEEAAGVAEAFLTAWQSVVWLAQLKKGESILIHAGASGVGTAAIQLAKHIGAEIAVTASLGKHPICHDLGAATCIDYHSLDFASAILKSNKNGVQVVIDFIGAPYFSKNVEVLSIDGRMVMLGFMGGTQMNNFDLRPFLFKRLKIMGSTLRSRSPDYKIRLTKDFVKNGLPMFENGTLKPVIDSVFDWKEVQQAHKMMESNKNQGKVILSVI